MSAFRSAREAYDEHEQVLSIDPARKDAGLIVGTYRYVVSALALPVRLMAYVVGFGGGRERGMHLVEEAAAYGGDNQTDARFALALDRFMPQLHNYHTQGRSWAEHGITADRVLERNECIAEGSSKLWECARALLDDAVAKGLLPRKTKEK